MELAIVIIALLVLGSLVPSGRALPQEIAALKWGQRIDLPYAKDDIKVLYKIPTTWRTEHGTLPKDSLAPHFEVLRGAQPHYQIRKMI